MLMNTFLTGTRKKGLMEDVVSILIKVAKETGFEVNAEKTERVSVNL